ncbi:unnamed protein product [Ilex paraguariensis]|uniref:TRF2/HOY1 PH-like domain-containing protein n=1 Tax=Ilex paraguariensis TaxID=185542 RepID=A0ABC8THP3_9AQUA
MVQLMRSDMAPFGNSNNLPLKLEIVDSLEEEHGSLNKRSKSSSMSPFDQWSTGSNDFPIPPSQYNPLDEPSPLGLRLRKSPSLMDLIQMRLSHGDAASVAAEPSGNLSLENKKDVSVTAASGVADKLKASNFPASHLRIGSWEYVSRYEGDLVAKCYFAKHKLVWEVLDGGLKSKIEIQWSDIMAVKAQCPDNGPGTLTLVLARQPLFFRETNPQPRKHTLWQATTDFTDGQASINRQHFLQCSQGLLNKHYEKLIQCDVRLNFLSRQPEIVLDSPYFEPRASVSKDPDDLKGHGINQLETAEGSPISGYQDVALPAAAQSSFLGIGHRDRLVLAPDHLSKEAPSPSSVMDTRAIEGNGNFQGYDCQGLKNWEQLKVPGLHPSMSVSDFVNHIGHRISEQMTSGNLPSEKTSERQDMLENIAQILFSDNQFIAASDEKSLMKRVNSLCSLLQDPATASIVHVDGQSHFEGIQDGKYVEHNRACDSLCDNKARSDTVASEVYFKEVPGCKQAPMARKDSFADLLLQLPRITSLPKFLFDISEDAESQTSS